jgi:hypothetical protein
MPAADATLRNSIEVGNTPALPDCQTADTADQVA